MISVTSIMNYPYGSCFANIVIVVYIYEYCPKPLHTNVNMVRPVNSRECGVICAPECVLPYSVLKCFLTVYFVHILYEISSLFDHLLSHQETYFHELFQYPHHLPVSVHECSFYNYQIT